MIYGSNFGGPAIPTTPRTAFRKFKERLTVYPQACSCPGCSATRARNRPVPERLPMRLVGLGQDASERDRMLLVATNGTRLIHVEPKDTVGGTWFGLYVD